MIFDSWQVLEKSTAIKTFVSCHDSHADKHADVVCVVYISYFVFVSIQIHKHMVTYTITKHCCSYLQCIMKQKLHNYLQ